MRRGSYVIISLPNCNVFRNTRVFRVFIVFLMGRGSNYYVVFSSRAIQTQGICSKNYILKRGNTAVIVSPRLRNSFRRTVTYRRSMRLCSSRLVILFNCGFLPVHHSQFMFLKMRTSSYYQ